MKKFINPFTDTGFRIIFGREASKMLLIDFLNCLLEGERYIQDITYLDTTVAPQVITGRGVVFDIHCESDTGEKFIVEMQNKAQEHHIERFLYYASRIINKQGEKGNEWGYDLKAVYGVFLLHYKKDFDELRTDAAITNLKTGKVLTDKLHMIFLALPYFDKKEEDCETDFERWLYVLTRMETLERMPWEAQKAAFQKLMKEANIANMTPEEREKYDAELDVYMVMENALKYSQKEGMEKGMKKIQLQIARNLKDLGIPSQIIAQSTGFSLEEVEKL